MPKNPDFFDLAYELKEITFDTPLATGERRSLGLLNWGRRKAAWVPDPNPEPLSEAFLVDAGLRLGRYSLPGTVHTVLSIRTDAPDITKKYGIDFTRRTLQVFTKASESKRITAMGRIIEQEKALREERRLGIIATCDDFQFVLDELERGASGLYAREVRTE